MIFFNTYVIIYQVLCASVAQLDRVIGYEPIGRGFESLRMCQKKRLVSTSRFFNELPYDTNWNLAISWIEPYDSWIAPIGALKGNSIHVETNSWQQSCQFINIKISQWFCFPRKKRTEFSVRFFSVKLYFVLYEKFICNIFEFFGT